MKRALLFFSAILILFAVLSLSCFSQGAEEDAANALPEEYKDLFLKDGRLALPPISVFLSKLFEAALRQLKESGADLLLFAGGILLSSVLSLAHSALGDGKDGVLRLCLLLFGCVSVFAAVKGVVSPAKAHLEAVCRLLAAFTPAVTASAVAAGGVSSAAVSAAALTVILSFVGQFSLGALFPLSSVTLTLDLTSAVTGQKVLSAFTRTLRTFFLFLLAAAGAVISAVFSFQNIIAAKSDGVALRAFRFTAGSALPLVGGIFSESSKTLLSGMGLIRSTVGAVGALTVLLMLLPTLLLLLTCRLVLSLSANLAEALDAHPLSSLYKSGASAVGMLAAVTAISDLCCFVAFAAIAV